MVCGPFILTRELHLFAETGQCGGLGGSERTPYRSIKDSTVCMRAGSIGGWVVVVN